MTFRAPRRTQDYTWPACCMAHGQFVRLGAQAETLDTADDPDSPSSSAPSSPDVSSQSEPSSSPSFSQAQATGDFQALGAEQAKNKKKKTQLRE